MGVDNGFDIMPKADQQYCLPNVVWRGSGKYVGNQTHPWKGVKKEL
ncbi:MAG: hypothetical protein AB1633_10840 [Elusimicrobiota bacterium]